MNLFRARFALRHTQPLRHFSTLRTLPQRIVVRRWVAPLPRQYLVRSFSTPNDPPPPEAQQTLENEQLEEDVEEDQVPNEDVFISALEDASQSPWINLPSSNDRESLQRSYFLLFQVFMYLGRPQPNATEESQAEYLLSFQDDNFDPDTEGYRARRAICLILSSVTRTLGSVPESSPLRSQHADIFATFGALVPLVDVYVGSQGRMPDEWKPFWERAMPIMITLCQQLGGAGFGFDDDEW